MLMWLLNIDFAGGTAVVVTEERSGRVTWDSDDVGRIDTPESQVGRVSHED